MGYSQCQTVGICWNLFVLGDEKPSKTINIHIYIYYIYVYMISYSYLHSVHNQIHWYQIHKPTMPRSLWSHWYRIHLGDAQIFAWDRWWIAMKSPMMIPENSREKSPIITRPGKRLQFVNWKDPPCYFHGKTHDFDWAIFNSFLSVYQRVLGFSFRSFGLAFPNGKPTS